MYTSPHGFQMKIPVVTMSILSPLQRPVELQGKDPALIPDELGVSGSSLIQEHLLYILDYAGRNKDKADRSWPVLLKSNQFFVFVTAYLAGIRKATIPVSGPSHPKNDKNENFVFIRDKI
jgi:hypothetical protein